MIVATGVKLAGSISLILWFAVEVLFHPAS